MASTPNTTRYVGDTGPPIKLEAADENGYLTTLPTAETVAFLAVNQADHSDTITGELVVIDPPEEDGENHWNLKYVIQAGDTDAAALFDLFATVTWGDGTIQTYGVSTLQIKAKT